MAKQGRRGSDRRQQELPWTPPLERRPLSASNILWSRAAPEKKTPQQIRSMLDHTRRSISSPISSVRMNQSPDTQEAYRVPQALKTASNRWATNHAPVLDRVNAVKAEVKRVGQAARDREAVLNVNRPSRKLTQANIERLSDKGVSLNERKNASCLSAHRPSDTKGSGGGRPFVPWCEKGGKK